MMDDRVNPVVVKELRQDLKSKSFVSSFMGLQLLMALCMLFYMIALRRQTRMSGINGFFWFFLALPLLMVSPLRAFHAIYEECKKQTLETIYLTHLTSWQITFGKWLALFIQNALMVVGILPYLVLRYFLGGINLADDLIALAILFFASSILTAAGVGLSSIQNRAMRGLLLSGAVVSLYIVPVMIFSVLPHMSSRWLLHPWALLPIIASLLLLLVFALEYGAAAIAPPAENHALRKRALAWLILLGILLGQLAGAHESIWIYGMLFMLPVCVDAVIETPRCIGSLYAANARRTPLLRLLGRLFYPGWPSGVFFAILLLAVLCLFIGIADPAHLSALSLFASSTATVLLPLALILLVKPDPHAIMIPYMAIQVGHFVLTVCSTALISVVDLSSSVWLSLLPMGHLFMTLVDDRHTREDGGLLLAICILAVALLIIALRMRPRWARILQCERNTRNHPKSEI